MRLDTVSRPHLRSLHSHVEVWDILAPCSDSSLCGIQYWVLLCCVSLRGCLCHTFVAVGVLTAGEKDRVCPDEPSRVTALYTLTHSTHIGWQSPVLKLQGSGMLSYQSAQGWSGMESHMTPIPLQQKWCWCCCFITILFPFVSWSPCQQTKLDTRKLFIDCRIEAKAVNRLERQFSKECESLLQYQVTICCAEHTSSARGHLRHNTLLSVPVPTYFLFLPGPPGPSTRKP